MADHSRREITPSQKAPEVARDQVQSAEFARKQSRVGFTSFVQQHTSDIEAQGGEERGETDVLVVPPPAAKRARKSKKWSAGGVDLVLAQAGLKYQVWKVPGDKKVQEKWEDAWKSLQQEPHVRIFGSKTLSACKSHFEQLVDNQSKRDGEAQRISGAGAEETGSEDVAEMRIKADLAKTLTAIVDAKAAAKQDSAEIKQKKANDEASNTRMGSWAVGQGNARCGPTARATQFGETRTNDERAYRTLTGQGTGGGSSGRASPAVSTGGMSSSSLATGGGGSSGRSSPTPNTDEDSDASRTPAYGGSSGRSSPTTTAGGTGTPSQARAGSGCGGRSGTVPPLGDELARVFSSPTISVLATRAGVTREQADLFLNSGFTSDLVPPDKAVAMMTLVVNDWLNEKREFATVDNFLSDMVEGGELEIEVPGFDGSVLHELLKNYGVSRDQFHNIPNAYHFANGWHAENNPTGAKFDKVTEQLAKLLTGRGGSTPARPVAAAGKTTGGEAGAGAAGNAGFSSRPDGAVGNRGRKPRNNKRKLQEDGIEGFMQQQLVDARQIADQRRQDDDKKEAAKGAARRREFEERLTFERTMREEEREAAKKDRDRERAENRDDLAAERAYQLKFLELQVQLANAKNKAQS